ncbi:hypothetical protein [Botrimarina hoheduenensis]|uniref:Uncharacterized protein n=1 Tax=Botrimarina hoheduenensis TaxID=2528000 RepID=A0A5C5WBW9_9BACT|nr:hypothetical protein [Botrimarina hoheduenensis]TWT47595.1 hypothetical protein Pla111_12100 [Botrimarina hoheduenensis]
MLRFVLLRHECPSSHERGSHWDLMLERAATAGDHQPTSEHRLITWSLMKLPREWIVRLARQAPADNDPLVALRLADHRAVYLDYEGPVGAAPGPRDGATPNDSVPADDVPSADVPSAADASRDRGTVERWARGDLLWITPATADTCRVRLENSPLAGELLFFREAEDQWLMRWWPPSSDD